MKLILTLTLLGLTLLTLGFHLYNIEETQEFLGKFWIKENSIIEAEASRLTWGLKLAPENYYRFKINFKANSSACIKAIDYSSTKILYAKQAQELNEEKIIKASKSFELTWLIENKNPNPIIVYQFTVECKAFIKPYMVLGEIFMVCGVAFLIALIVKLAKITMKQSLS
ncbi:hypothetical protein KEJ50_01680 [Candidatus Bathyarchaeota archaeon]|nr:hypothetical protein [Candidatus Bathyarchaeota archaeon]